MISCHLADPDSSVQFAQAFARHIQRFILGSGEHVRVALEGSLGAGKSHLARAMLRAWGVQGPIPSPTYSLLEPYETATPAAAHMDWYRLADPLELEMLDWESLCQQTPVILVEWASRLPDLASQMDLVLSLQVEGSGRRLQIRAYTPVGSHLLDGFDPELEKDSPG